jgi:hypothetical protein
VSNLLGRAKKALQSSTSGQSRPETSAKKRRLAVLGVGDVSAGSADWTVHSFPWSYGGETAVVADYDVALVNLLDTGLQESFIRRGLSGDVNGEVVFGLLRAAGQLLLAGGEIVVLGHPDFHVKTQSGLGAGFARHWSSMPHWTGMVLEWDENAGDKVERAVGQEASDPASRFFSYLQLVRRYDYSLLSATVSEDFLNSLGPVPAVGTAGAVERSLRLETRPLAKTRRGGAIASEHRVRVFTRPVARRQEGWTGRQGGTVWLLPGCEMTPRETVAYVLREAYGVHIALPAPPWLANIAAPGEAAIVTQLAAAQAELDAAASKLAALEAQRDGVRAVLGVVAAGEDELENRVRDLLGSLGAQVEPPIERNKEDGWISVEVAGKVLEGVLEIKSTRNPGFDEAGLRQLMDWVSRTESARKRPYKGIFIGNSAYARPPEERGDPFSSSFRATAQAHGFVAITVVTLLRELRRVVDEGADPAAFWSDLFERRGVRE